MGRTRGLAKIHRDIFNDPFRNPHIATIRPVMTIRPIERLLCEESNEVLLVLTHGCISWRITNTSNCLMKYMTVLVN